MRTRTLASDVTASVRIAWLASKIDLAAGDQPAFLPNVVVAIKALAWQFARKAGRVIDLYQRCWKGTTLGPHDYVLCIDEKTSIQARRRKPPSLPPAPGRAIYVEHEYARAGALAYVAAWDVHRARLFGRCERKNSIAAFHRLVGKIMRREPYRSARRVFLITDNGSCHRGRRAADRLHAKWASFVTGLLGPHCVLGSR